MGKNIRLNESQFNELITESVNRILTEMDWKTYINASRKRKEQADNFRNRYWDGMNSYDDRADELEKHAQKMFAMKHGKNGEDHNYEGDSPSYMGRISGRGNHDFAIKNKPSFVFKNRDDGSDVELRKYRYGNGIPYRNGGKVHDDTLDNYHNWDWDRNVYRQHTMGYDKDGEHYDTWNSSIGNEISMSKDKDYNARQDAMSKDMLDYYTGKSKYIKGKGW